MVRVAAIDCGSNSTRLLISNVENGRLENLLKQHEVTKLSENLIKTNRILSLIHISEPTRQP